jgi:hypothetical protein
MFDFEPINSYTLRGHRCISLPCLDERKYLLSFSRSMTLLKSVTKRPPMTQLKTLMTI